MHFITGGIMHETHTFSVEPTTVDTFPTCRGEACWSYTGTNSSPGGVIAACQARDIELVHTIFCSGVATGTPDRANFDALVTELTERIGAALPADGVVLTLHGAMVAEGAPDAEAEIVRRVRETVGPEMPIAVTLDFHANIGQEMVDACEIVTTYDTYPHTDAGERSHEATELLARVVDGEIRPTMALVKPPLLPVPQAMYTSRPPFQRLFERAHALEAAGDALTITVAGGFPYADTPVAGVSILVTTDDDPAAAERLARELADLAWSLRERMIVENATPSDARHGRDRPPRRAGRAGRRR